jgi:hypothetical protein
VGLLVNNYLLESLDANGLNPVVSFAIMATKNHTDRSEETITYDVHFFVILRQEAEAWHCQPVIY